MKFSVCIQQYNNGLILKYLAGSNQTLLDSCYGLVGRQTNWMNYVTFTNKHMGGLALMVISPKKWEFLPFFKTKLWIIQLHLKSFNDFI